MGVITRFRARLHALQALAKLDPQAQAEKTAQTVCLLSVVLLLPYLAGGHASILVGGVGLGYSCLVLPMVISANYRYPVSLLKAFAVSVQVAGIFKVLNLLSSMLFLGRISDQLLFKSPAVVCLFMNVLGYHLTNPLFHERCQCLAQPLLNFLSRVYAPVDVVERVFMRMTNIFTLVNQLIFFVLCDRVLVPNQRVTALYSLMFYNVIAYCVSYIKELIEKEDWSPWVRMTDHSNIKHLAMSATKIVLEWTKAVTFIITVVFMLLVFGLEQGLEHYKPTVFYNLITLAYYVVTEKVFVELLLTFITYLQLPQLENLEGLWIPVIFRVYTAIISFFFAAPLIFYGQYRSAFIAMYVNVYLRCKEMKLNSLSALNQERAVLTQFRYASSEELAEFDDVCAVCLSPMKLARITPCHHMFHGECLRQCLKTSDHCPICKRELKFD